MKKKFLLILLALVSALCLVFGITACGEAQSGSSSVAGKYYLYENSTYDHDQWIKLKKKTWTTSESDSDEGEYEVTGTSIALYTEMAGTKVIFSRGTVKDGVLTLETGGVTRTFCKSGAKPNNSQTDDHPGHDEPEKPEASYKTVSFFLNGGDGSLDSMQFEVGKVMADLPTPERDGYNFIGWKDAFGKAYSTSSVMPNENLELYAQWEKVISSYEDDFVSLKPASEGYKDSTFPMTYGGLVDKFVYVELTSDDLGGPSYVGQDNNFTLRTLDSMEYKVNRDYSWQWYQGNFSTPNGAQRFTLQYGSNIQFVTVSDGSGVVQQTYLLDIYVKHDYYVKLYTDFYAKEPYKTVRVIENERLDADTPVYTQGNYSKFEFDCRKYYNESTRKYEEYIYSTPVQHDIKLYQTYKPYAIEADLDEGTLSEKLTVVPYTENATLPTPTKEGYDFLGWQWENGKYFSDITGYLGVNYLNAENVGMELKAVYAKKQFAYTVEQKEDEEIHSVLETVPVVTYTDETQTEIFYITYVIRGSYVSPEKTPFHEDKIFVNWQTYDHKTGEKEKIAYDTPVTAPIALFANEANASYFNGATGTSKAYNVVPLNAARTFTSGSINSEYRAYLPTDGEYTLEISTTGEVALTVSQYGSTQSRSYTVKSSTPSTIYLQYKGSGSTIFPDGGYITFSVTSLSGSFTTHLSGATTRTEESPLPYDELLTYGEEHTFTLSPDFVDKKVAAGYIFPGWFDEKDNSLGEDDINLKIEKPVIMRWKRKAIDYNLTLIYDNTVGDAEDIPTSYTVKGLKLPVLIGKNNNKHISIGWKAEDGTEYTEEIPQGTTGERTLTVIWGVTEGNHTWKDDNTCSVCGAKKPYTVSAGRTKVYFGEYPQTEVTNENDSDKSLRNSLNMDAGVPSAGNAGKWTDYGYYISGSVQSYMWYIDVEYQGNRYRGVYFTSYRPDCTTRSSSTSNSYQDDNGYYINTVYWFKWEPIEWRILEEKDGKAFLMSNIILDSQQYYHEDFSTRTINGKTVYPNNYKESDIRAWLTGTFYETAFDEYAKAIIETTTVDNSAASSTASGNNFYACENTQDKVFLLSYKEVLNTSYGFSSSDSTYDMARWLKSTDYAKSQGVYVNTAYNSSRGNGLWWLRSPYYADSHFNDSEKAYHVDSDGDVDDDGMSFVDHTDLGVVPALRIRL